MRPKVMSIKTGRVGFIEQYLPNDMCIVRYSDSSWGWENKTDLKYFK